MIMNLVIFVSLISIGLALVIGYAVGFRKGVQEEREEAETRHSRIATKQRIDLLFGAAHSRN